MSALHTHKRLLRMWQWSVSIDRRGPSLWFGGRWVWRPLCWFLGQHEPWTERPGRSLYCLVCSKDLFEKEGTR